jgi:hypothetical protein
MTKLINIELETKRITRTFAEKQGIKVEVYFHRPPGTKYSEEWLKANGLHDGVPGGLHKLCINLNRDNRSLIFRTLAHELAHAWQQEQEEKQYSGKHNLSFWQTLDDYTLPFVLDSLSREDHEGLLNLLNPTTNQDEERDWVRWEAEEKIISFSVESEYVDQQWKIIRQETIKGNLGTKAFVSTKRTSQNKYRLSIYVNDNPNQAGVAQIIEKLIELGFNESEIKVK